MFTLPDLKLLSFPGPYCKHPADGNMVKRPSSVLSLELTPDAQEFCGARIAHLLPGHIAHLVERAGDRRARRGDRRVGIAMGAPQGFRHNPVDNTKFQKV